MNAFIEPSELIINSDGSIYHLGVCPSQIATDILTVGDPERVSNITRYFDKTEKPIKRREFVTQSGEYNGKRLTVMSTGMGTDNIDIFLNELDALFNVDFTTRTVKENHQSLRIIRIGTSGSVQPDIEIDTLLVATKSIGLDVLPHYYTKPSNIACKPLQEALQKHLQSPLLPSVSSPSMSLLNSIGNGLLQGNTMTCAGFYAPQGRSIRLSPAIPDWIEKVQSFRHQDFKITNLEMETSGYYLLGTLLGHQVLSVNAILANRITRQFSKQPEKTVEKLILHVLEKITAKHS